MKYLLLLILPLLSNAVVIGSSLSLDASAGSLFSYVYTEREFAESGYNEDTPPDYGYNLDDALSSSFVVAPKDTFPVQIGAFRIKSNAEKISERVKKHPDIKVKIRFEEGLYKVRINKIPETVKSETTFLAALSDKEKVIQHTEIKSETFVDSSAYIGETRTQPVTSDTLEIAGDTVNAGDKGFIFKGNSPWLKRIKYFGESFALVNALIISILISISTMIILLVLILMNRRRMEQEEKVKQYLMEKYQSLIVDYLYGSATSEEFASIASDNYRRQVLIDQMIDVSVNLKGDESNRLFGLYKHLGLDRDSLARARDYRWHKKIKGFRELAHMGIQDANDIIRKALNSSNEILRMEAQIALVRLSNNDHFGFLSQMKRPFSLWEQITLHDLILQHNIPVPEFKKWLTVSNDSVVLFALRMIREFKQTDAEEGITDSLVHTSPAIRLLAVQVAGDLRLSSTLEIMKRMYKTQDYKTCLEIVKSMGKMPDTSMLGFLKLVLDKEDDVQLQIEATKSIEKMGEVGVKALVKIMKSEYKNYNIIVRHVLDRRIN